MKRKKKGGIYNTKEDFAKYFGIPHAAHFDVAYRRPKKKIGLRTRGRKINIYINIQIDILYTDIYEGRDIETNLWKIIIYRPQ